MAAVSSPCKGEGWGGVVDLFQSVDRVDNVPDATGIVECCSGDGDCKESGVFGEGHGG